jgi:peptidoglycan/LPS O-acetylase OafA/YrhL
MRRLSYLEGLRGIAALLVLSDHFLHGFANDFARTTRLGYLLSNGAVAVDIFFLLSGVVLTYAFERAPRDVPGGMARRIIRLGVPLLAACLLACLIRTAGQDALREAAAAAHSTWLESRLVPLSYGRALLDGTVLTITGYADTTLFAPLTPYLPPWSVSSDPPIWSLHIEFWGSLFALLLVAARSYGRWPYRAALAAMALAAGPAPIALFLLGHLSAPLARAEKNMPRLGLALIVPGLGLAATSYLPGQYRILDLARPVTLLNTHGFYKLTPLIAAILLFYGVVLTPLGRTLLSARPLVWLGQLSFAIYLVHAPVLLSIGAAAYLTGGIPIALAATLAVTLALALLFDRLVNRPAIRWSHAIAPIAAPSPATP